MWKSYHLIEIYDFPEKRMACQARRSTIYRTGKIPVNTAKASSTKNVSTARHSFNRQAALTSTAMKVNTDIAHRALKNKGIVDSGCSRHMTGNKAYLAEFQDFNGGPVAFGGSKEKDANEKLKLLGGVCIISNGEICLMEKAIGTKVGLSNKKDERGVFVRIKLRYIFGLPKKSWCDEIEALMKSRFQMSSMGELTFFLGLQVKQKTQKPLVKDEEASDVDVHLYRFMIGSLMYLTASRPDIMFAVCACLGFQVTSKSSNLSRCQRELKFLDSDYVEQILTKTFHNRGLSISGQEDSFLGMQKKQTIGLLGIQRVYERVFDGTKALMLPTLFILWLATVSTDSASSIHHAFNGKYFSGKVTPLFASMLVQPTEDKGAPSERPSEAQLIPSPHTSEVPVEQLDPSPTT
ncbi:hypothetical protein Tco_1494046 [Tanacetum coccineum]